MYSNEKVAREILDGSKPEVVKRMEAEEERKRYEESRIVELLDENCPHWEVNDVKWEGGPTTRLADEIHAKYRGDGESFHDAMVRIADKLADDEEHFEDCKDILINQRFLPGGRIQSAVGTPKRVTAYNCFVAPTIEDSMDGIMDVAKYAATTMRLGGDIGYDFSTIRPKGSRIKSLNSHSSGPLSFMDIFDAVCSTVASAGNRRGAQMAVLRIDHPDIEAFIESKTNSHRFKNFNISVGVTDDFMVALTKEDDSFDLVWDGRVVEKVSARALWDKIMRATWDWADPGVLFIDQIALMNNLWYCEKISATNPCGEQPLPPNGACLLGSFNLTKYLNDDMTGLVWRMLEEDIHDVVRMMDNVIDNTVYPHPNQKYEAENKRRMGLGVTGLANTLELMGFHYGSEVFLDMETLIFEFLRDEAYRASCNLAHEKGSFPLYEPDLFEAGAFFNTLPEDIQDGIKTYGIRNSHLLSVAPTGTISITADNVSSGIEPVFAHEYDRTIILDDGPKTERVKDYAVRKYGVYGRKASEVTIEQHLAVMAIAQKYVDSAVSKTINVGSDVSWKDFKDIYFKAWTKGCKGVTTFRAAGKRYGILNEVETKKKEGTACYIDPKTGEKECS